MHHAIRFTLQLILLGSINWCGSQIALATNLPLPGTVIGIVLLFLLLISGIIKLHQIEHAANFLLKHMLFLFIPIAVGLMNWGSLLRDNGMILIAAIALGAVIPLVIVGLTGQKMIGDKKTCNTP